jgi:hypothetical protein
MARIADSKCVTEPGTLLRFEEAQRGGEIPLIDCPGLLCLEQ